MEDNFWDYNCYIFDLDNTLYEENDYLFSAYKEISEYLEEHFQINKILIENYLFDEFMKSGRSDLFTKMISHFEFPENILKKVLQILRNHRMKNSIKVYPEMKKLISDLFSQDKRICIVTNGNVIQQRNKIDQINWLKQKEIQIVYANEIKPKPSPDSVLFLMKSNKLLNEEAIFIGDSEVDELCARRAGISFLHVDALLKR